ncbi:hypothetical protein, partial [Dyadobacter sp. LHD-138]|uniref:hypothetical protein n=1 Tax=Dyadobacter sp. LHD-138 TaxID=3071413 RepID=UPI0027E044CF
EEVNQALYLIGVPQAHQLNIGSKGSGEWKIPQDDGKRYCLANSSNKRLQFHINSTQNSEEHAYLSVLFDDYNT